MLLDLKPKLSDEANLLSHNLVELLVLIVGIGREVLVQVVLRDRINYVVCHTGYSI